MTKIFLVNCGQRCEMQVPCKRGGKALSRISTFHRSTRKLTGFDHLYRKICNRPFHDRIHPALFGVILCELTFLPVFLLPPLLRMESPMEAKLPPLDSLSVRLNLLKWSWNATDGPESVGRRSCAPVCEMLQFTNRLTQTNVRFY